MLLTWLILNSLKAAAKLCKTRKQGIYLVIVIKRDETVERYVGSGFGKDGLWARTQDHLDPKYRAMYPNKALYHAINDPDTVSWHIIPLIIFEERMDEEVVKIGETASTALFHSHPSEHHLLLMFPEERTWIPHKGGLNRTVPIDEHSGIKFGAADNYFERERLRRRLTGVNAWNLQACQSGKQTRYKLSIGTQNVELLAKILKEHGIKLPLSGTQEEIWVRFDLSDLSVHRHKWAINCNATHDGARLAIRVFKDKEHADDDDGGWLQSKAKPETANAFYDLIKGRMFGEGYELPDDRAKLFVIGKDRIRLTNIRRPQLPHAPASLARHGTVWGDSSNAKYQSPLHMKVISGSLYPTA